MTSDQEHKSSSRLVRYQWPVVLTLGVALFLGAVGGGFYLYVQDRERYYNDRYFRLLNSQAEDVSRRLDSYRDVMYSAGRAGYSGRFKGRTKEKSKIKLTYDLLPKVIDAANEENEEGVPSEDFFLSVRSTKCRNSRLDNKQADTIGLQLCQVSDFSNVSVSSTSFQIGSEANPFLGRQSPASSKENQGAKTKAALKTVKKSSWSPSRSIEENKENPWIEQCLSGRTPHDGTFHRAARFVSKATPFFGVATQWRSSRSIVVVQALVPSLLIEEAEDKCLYNRWRITAEVDGKNLFGMAFRDHSFDDLLLVDSKGNVLAQAGESGHQFVDANILFSGRKGASDPGSEPPQSPPAGQSIGGEAGGLEFQIQVERKDDTTLLKKVPTRQEVIVGGKSMYVFALPLNLPFIDKDQEKLEGNPERKRSLIILGLVSKDKFRNETWQLSPSALLIFLFIVLLVLLILPLLKLFSMGVQDQWSVRDLTLVVGAGIVGAGLLTLALVDAGAFRWTKEQIDDELNQFAGAMAQHTREELWDAIIQLKEFDERRANKLEVADQETKKEFKDLKGKQSIKEKTCEEKQEEIRPPSAMLNALQMKGITYKTFDSVFWINCGGRLEALWDARLKNDYYPPIVTNLSDRSYFTSVINRRYWQFKDVDTPFALEPLFSRIDGSNTAVVAIQSKRNPSANPEDIVVAGLESRFLSLFEPIIPPGTGFAVVDDSNGKVLFHSQGQRNLREKFFEETDHDMGLKALITSRAEGCEDGIYGGNSHRFCVSAFKDLPWALVVFKNMEPLRTANLEAVTVASVLYVIYSFAVLLAVIGGLTVHQIYHQGVPIWLWPSRDSYIQYMASALVTVGLLLVGMFSLWWLPPQYAFVTGVILLPTIGAFATYALLNRKSLPTSFAKLDNIVNYRQAYVMVCGTMLALCSVLPAAVCMTLSYESEQTLLLKADVLDLAKSFAKRADQIKERYQYHDRDDRKKLIERIYGTDPKPSYNLAMPWCARRLDNPIRRDVHFAYSKDEYSWLEEMFRSSPDFIACEEEGNSERSAKLVSDREDWFEETYRFIRVPYNDEFARTQGLFPKSQKPEKSEKSKDVQSEDVHWYVSEGMKIVSYRPVHDLKRLDNSEGSARWNVAFTLRPRLTRLPGIILLGCAISGVLLAYRKPPTTPGTISSFRVLAIGITIVSILIWPGETLLFISVLLLLLFFAWLIYLLPGFIARRVFLLDLVPIEVDRSDYVNKLRESLASSTFTEDEKKTFDEEFRVSDQLCEIGKALIEQWDPEKKSHFQSEITSKSLGFDPNAVALFLCDKARFRYEDAWMAMSNEEKMALFHLAKSGFIHREHPGLLSLFKKGWILCSPQLRYVNESFRQFVQSRKEEAIMLQDQLAGGIWGHLTGPLGFGMIFILAGLMYTQQELLTGVTALVGVLAGLVPVISKVFDLFKGQKASSSAS